jgi:hypothetical protein
MSAHPVPAGFGPVLVTARSVPPSQRMLCLVTISVFSGLVIGYCRLRGCDWWWTMGTAIVMFILLYVCNFNVYMRAGDGWFASNNGFLRTDKLTRVRVRVITSGKYVTLWDADARHIDVPLSELTNDPKIWALVIAGIDVSRAAGLVAEDHLTARIFGLPLATASTQPLDVPGEHNAQRGAEAPAPKASVVTVEPGQSEVNPTRAHEEVGE